jgi:hypothetical protein
MFRRSDSVSIVFGVSRSFGILAKRASLRSSRNASSPISPSPMCWWRSTRLPRPFFESLRWKTPTF